ncbi:MFS transporter [Listeria fleischmannii]|uniref:MFS transporter n=1 Tax=Listeria fleischmannii TaxID=1069827 RepID=A0A841YHD8_9LIST|nr:MFS transporter [Listeria fleischmannii]MBC1399815.1 MFS transporter [Listeria fleischmannii]MBC1428124.1 MFS transporter [Listeria fleischmannii]STY34989.1 Vacuole effluxer Atg22 like [Listeria fleischmannii subsp. coloradonensis]
MYTKEEKSWILQDWANSAYSIMITTAILPIYFKSVAANAGISDSLSTAYWGYTNSVGTLLISCLAPILGTIADYQFFKKRFFSLFTCLGVACTLSFMFVPYDGWLMLLGLYALSLIGFSGANIFYDSFLIDVTTNERMDRISSAGYAYGYLGSSIPFIAFIVLKVTGILPIEEVTLVNIGFLMTAIWWLGFTIPFFKNVHQIHYLKKAKNPIQMSFKRLFNTLRQIRSYRTIALFLIAYFFYIDGVDTIFRMATSYGIDLGISATTLILILLVTQLIAFPFTILYGFFAKKWGAKCMILVAIVIYLIICIYAVFMDTVVDFWILAILVGTSQGGIQALSRSFYGKIIPKERSNEFYGFYNIFGKFSAIIGPALLGVITQLTGNTSYGVASLIVLFIIGGTLFLFVREKEI